MTDSPTLAGDRWAPVTSRIGFLRAPVDDVADHLQKWRTRIHRTADVRRFDAGLAESIHALEPLTAGVRPRDLLVATGSSAWTAVFDCGVQGGDQVTTVGYLARTMLTQGVVVLSIPDRAATEALPDRYGARQLEMFAPIPTDFINYTRTISVVRDGARSRFDAIGMVQDFEDESSYRRRRIADRFTAQMLKEYAAALDLHPWDLNFYPGASVLITTPAISPLKDWVLTIAEAQQRSGITAAGTGLSGTPTRTRRDAT